eukprot:GGOE01036930.1.p1 GENE.GGOE01036930.1~~GGOE01036930.1.p1  ORF type:complete len:201 (-),score=44.54 GGOE01036930.1:273-875(-)
MNLSRPSIVIVGSSVAAGYHASHNHGWAQQLEGALKQRNPHWVVRNEAIPGLNSSETQELLHCVLQRSPVSVVVIGLSLANEGLLEDLTHPPVSFTHNVKAMVEACHAMGSRAVLGGLYPNDCYSPDAYTILQSVDSAMTKWGADGKLEFLAATDDGRGHWRREFAADPGHPNDVGHRAMFDAIDLSLFDRLLGSGSTAR